MNIRILILVVGLLATGIGQASQMAGKTMVARGKVNAISEDSNTPRKLKRRAPVYGSDVVTTGEKGKAQIRMTDGGMIALKANSELVIADYEYSTDDGKGSVVMELVKGGLRSVTGAIKADSGDYKLKTPVGSIGIRGTHYEIEMVGSEMFIAVWDGAIDVQVETGVEAGNTLSFGDGEDYSYASIDEEGNVTEFIDPPENFNSGMSSEADDSDESEESEESDSEEEGAQDSDSEQEEESEQEESEQEESSEEEEQEEEQTTQEESEESQQEEESSQQEESSGQESEEQSSEQASNTEESQSGGQQQSSQTTTEQPTTTESEQQPSAAEESIVTGSDTTSPDLDAEQGDSALSAESLVEADLDQETAFDPTEQEVGSVVEELVEDESFLATDEFNTLEPETQSLEDLIGAREGKFTYDQVESAVSGDGNIANFQMFMTIDFNTLGVTEGDMTFEDDGQWRASFSGTITNQGEFNLDISHASHDNNLADGTIDAAFLEGVDSILGNFTLQEIIDSNVSTSGTFTIK